MIHDTTSPKESNATQQGTGGGWMRRLVRILRFVLGWLIIAGLPVAILVPPFFDDFAKASAILVASILFGAVFAGILALGLWLVYGGKNSHPNATVVARAEQPANSDSENE